MMAKLYWRVKLNNKWTWRPARSEPMGGSTWVEPYDVSYEVEEE